MISFPENFVWGTATASYQIEGAWRTEGRGRSIWDEFARIPGKVSKAQNGDVACDHYNWFREDVAMMKSMGVAAYRFSISWPRIFATGRGELNESGLRFYGDLIDCLHEHEIDPWVTLYHWDLPLMLQREVKGWLGSGIADLFVDFADVCFDRFGDRVKKWITINEPWCCVMLGIGQGTMAPGRVSSTEPYIAGHNLIPAHAKAVDLYRRNYQDQQKGEIGIANNCDWREPYTDSTPDADAAQRSLECFLGWFADPIYLDDYPESMRGALGKRLPQFSELEKEQIKGSSDFFGLNHYTTMFAGAPLSEDHHFANVQGNGGVSSDQDFLLYDDPSWEKTDMGWSIVPWGCRKLLEWISDRYGKRFGLHYVDFETQERIPKMSAKWYSEVARTGTISR